MPELSVFHSALSEIVSLVGWNLLFKKLNKVFHSLIELTPLQYSVIDVLIYLSRLGQHSSKTS